jgi:hypothetical protein
MPGIKAIFKVLEVSRFFSEKRMTREIWLYGALLILPASPIKTLLKKESYN